MRLGGRVGIDIQGNGDRGEVILPWKDTHVQTVPKIILQPFIFASSAAALLHEFRSHIFVPLDTEILRY